MSGTPRTPRTTPGTPNIPVRGVDGFNTPNTPVRRLQREGKHTSTPSPLRQRKNVTELRDPKIIKRTTTPEFIVDVMSKGIYGIIFVCLAGFLFNKGLALFETTTLQPLGRIVDLGHHTVNLYCQGPVTDRTIFYVEGTDSFLTSVPLLDLLAKSHRVCAYDRGNRGFSGWYNEKITGEVLVSELENVTKASGEKGPHILVGNSLGALIAAAYAVENPSRVAELVMINPIGTSVNVSSTQGQELLGEILSELSSKEVLSITGVARGLALVGHEKLGYPFSERVAGLMNHVVTQQRGYAAAITELRVAHDQLVHLLQSKKSNKVDSTHLIYGTAFSSNAASNAEWSTSVKKESLLNHLGESVAVSTTSKTKLVPNNFPRENAAELATLILKAIKHA